MRSLNNIEIPFSNFRTKILDVLKKEGYIINYVISDNKNNTHFLEKSEYYLLEESKKIGKFLDYIKL